MSLNRDFIRLEILKATYRPDQDVKKNLERIEQFETYIVNGDKPVDKPAIAEKSTLKLDKAKA